MLRAVICQIKKTLGLFLVLISIQIDMQCTYSLNNSSKQLEYKMYQIKTNIFLQQNFYSMKISYYNRTI